MKKSINFIAVVGILILTMLSCKKDPNITITSAEEELLSYIEISDLENWLPEEHFANDTKVVYINESGQEKKLNLYMVRGAKERVTPIGNHDYSSESFTIRMRDDNDITFILDIEGYALYGEKNDLQKTLFVLLMPGNESGSMILPVQFDENGAKITPINIFEEEVSLFGHVYKNVYKGGAFSDTLLFESFSEVALNSEVGIVYFRDRVNDMWVFDRFE